MTLYISFNSEQTEAVEVTSSMTTKSYHSQTCFNNTLGILSEWEIKFLSSYFSEKCSNQCKVWKDVFLLLYIRLENLVY